MVFYLRGRGIKMGLVTSCLMAALLLVVSCSPAEGEVEKGETIKWTGTRLDGTVVEKQLEKPQYGGTYTVAVDGSPSQFDDIRGIKAGFGVLNWISNPVQETIMTRDWLRGPVGSEEWDPQNSSPVAEVTAGLVVESWELVEPDIFALHVRKGIHWQNIPPLNGRELTPEDVVYSLRRIWKIGYYAVAYSSYLADENNVENSIYISPDDSWTVYLKYKPGMAGAVADVLAAGMFHVVAPELFNGEFESFLTATDWQKIIGTGPYTIEDYVPDTSITYRRNPDYWRKDPFFPENQLPYPDTLKFLIIPDKSTRLSALRTGDIDSLRDLKWEDREDFLKTNPEIEWSWTTGPGMAVHMRNDTGPFNDIKVRQALMLAVDQGEILNEYYGGNAALFAFPIAPLPELAHIYVPLEEMPKSVQELYEYHPDKAKQLLTEAGYPDGFETTVITDNDLERQDLLAIVKDYWAKIGVDLKIDVKEGGAFTGARMGQLYTQMIIYEATGENPFTLATLATGGGRNYSIVSDEEIDESLEQIRASYFDREALSKIWREPTATRPGLSEYITEQAFSVYLPTAYFYVGWQPWLKGYGGVTRATKLADYSYVPYIWIDQQLKQTMGH
ncbi:MAG: ABC transporter substrate-binding protein [Dehalococcoidales bacterium]|nr:ABC transporter substrate-binding protein [Dehalococcoidales bacterium]